MSYYEFINNIDVNNVKTIFELGSCDLNDAIKLADYFEDSKIYAFECNPDCLIECHKNIYNLSDDKKKRIFLILIMTTYVKKKKIVIHIIQ